MNSDISQEQRKLLEKITVTGNLHKLLPGSVKSKTEINRWVANFEGSFDSRDKEVFTNFRYLWEGKDVDDKAAPQYGIAADIDQLKYLIHQGRIRCEDVNVDVTTWKQIMDLTEFHREAVKGKDENNKDTVLATATVASSQKALDQIVEFITGKFYSKMVGVGEKTEAYFADYSKNLLAMSRLNQKALYFIDEVTEAYFEGNFQCWEGVVSAIEANCGVDDEIEMTTMLKIMKRMKDIASSDRITETKIAQMRTEMEKIAIRGSENYFGATDYKKNAKVYWQRFDEEYSPMINTLFQCLIFATSNLPESKWKAMQEEFYGQIKDKPSYINWQKNRHQMYKIIDRETRERRKQAGQNQIEKEESQEGEDANDSNDVNAINQKKKKGQSKSSQRNKNRNKGENSNANNWNGKSSNLLQSASNNNNQSGYNNGNRNSLQGNNQGRKLEPICNNCSHFAKTPVRHAGPFKGKGPKCIFDNQGNRINRRRQMNVVDNGYETYAPWTDDNPPPMVGSSPCNEFEDFTIENGEIHVNAIEAGGLFQFQARQGQPTGNDI